MDDWPNHAASFTPVRIQNQERSKLNNVVTDVFGKNIDDLSAFDLSMHGRDDKKNTKNKSSGEESVVEWQRFRRSDLASF